MTPTTLRPAPVIALTLINSASTYGRFTIRVDVAYSMPLPIMEKRKKYAR